jgi:hypothetical protein
MSKVLLIPLLLIGGLLCLHSPSINEYGAMTSASSQFAIPVTGRPNNGKPTQNSSRVPSLADFAETVNMGRPEAVAGVYVLDLFADKIVHQPPRNSTYISSLNQTVTNLDLAARNETVGLAAHNYLAGALFSKLTLGIEVDLVNGDGSVRRYVVSEIARFQALAPTDPFSSFVESDMDEMLSSTDLFSRMYIGGDKVVLQTCISLNGDSSWGRLFVTATPVQ